MNRCLRPHGSVRVLVPWLAAVVTVLWLEVATGEAAIPLKRVILEGKVVAGSNQTPVNRVWVAVFARGAEPVSWDWTRADGTFRCNQPVLPGKYRIELRPVNHVFQDSSVEIDLPELAPGETEESLLTAGRFMSARGILEQPVNQVIVDRVATKTKNATETVINVIAALVDAVNEFYYEESRVLTIPMVEDVPLRTVTFRGSVRGLLGRGRLRGGIARFFWKDHEIGTVATDLDYRFELKSVEVPVARISVVAGDRFGLFQRVEREVSVTPETTVIQLDDLVCGLRGWVKVTLWLLLAIVLWFAIRGRRTVGQPSTTEAVEPTTGRGSPTTPTLTDADLWHQRLIRAVERLRAAVYRAWAPSAEAKEGLVISTWFWVHGGLCLFLAFWVGLQLYGHTIRASGMLSQGEAGLVLRAEQLRETSAWTDRESYKEALQVPTDFTPLQALIWSCILSVFPFRQTAWQCAHLVLFCLSALLVYFGAWAFSQRAFRFPAGGSAAGLCAAALFLLCPAALTYSCTLYPETLSLFLASASVATWCLVGVTPVRPTFTVCSFLLATTFLFHPMHGLIVTVVLAVGTILRGDITSETLTDLGFLLLPGAAAVTILSRVFLPDTSRLMYAFLARGEDMGWLRGVRWCFERLLADYSPYRGGMLAALFLVVAVVWINPDRRVRGLAGGLVAGLFWIASYRGKHWSSCLALIPVLVLFPGLAVEAAVAHVETERRKPYAVTIATLVFFLAPLAHPQLYQKKYYQSDPEWNAVLERLLPTIDRERGALIIGENSQIPPEAVNVALVERYEANLETIYRPTLQGTITPSGERISDVTETYNEMACWLQNELVGSVSSVELLPGHPLLSDPTYLKGEGWSQTWVALMKSQPWYPETSTLVVEDQKVAIHVYRRAIEPCHIGRSRRIDSRQAGITRLALLDEGGRHTIEVEPGRTMQVRARVVNLLDSELRGSLWWVISDRFAQRPWDRMHSEAKRPILLPPDGREEFASQLAVPGKPGKYWLVAYLHAEDGTHLDAAFLEDDIRVELSSVMETHFSP